MKLFKKKHERSAWFEGLLEAEDFCKHSGNGTTILYLNTEVIGLDSDEHSSGWQDYIEHYQKISKINFKTLDFTCINLINYAH